LGLDEESLTSREKPIEEEIKIDKTVDKQPQSTKEQEQQKVHKVSVRNLEAWFRTKQALKNIKLDLKGKTVCISGRHFSKSTRRKHLTNFYIISMKTGQVFCCVYCMSI
jgi:ABC-type transport system involved in cytochrome bd biosynthesis fused ATPase/permease subunit